MHIRKIKTLGRKILLLSLVFMLTFGTCITYAFAWQASQETINEMTNQVKTTPHTQNIVISKSLSGNYPEADINKKFSFTLTINDSVKYNFKLKAKESVTYKIEKGDKYTVTEADYSSSGYTPKQKVYSGVASDEDIYITYINVYKSGSSGGHHHTTPDPDDPEKPDIPDDPENPDLPDNPDNYGGDDNAGGDKTNDDSGGSNKTDGNSSTDKNQTKVPKTGDESMLVIWILILLMSIQAGVVVVMDEKFKIFKKPSTRKK